MQSTTWRHLLHPCWLALIYKSNDNTSGFHRRMRLLNQLLSASWFLQHYILATVIMSALYANANSCVVTNSIYFKADGSGVLALDIQGPDSESVANIFGITHGSLPESTLKMGLSNSLNHINFKEIFYSIDHSRGVHIKANYSFNSPSNVVEWLDDNKKSPGKYIKWSKDEVEVNFVFTADYSYDQYIMFDFDDYTIVKANGIILDSRRCIWKYEPEWNNLHICVDRKRKKTTTH